MPVSHSLCLANYTNTQTYTHGHESFHYARLLLFQALEEEALAKWEMMAKVLSHETTWNL